MSMKNMFAYRNKITIWKYTIRKISYKCIQADSTNISTYQQLQLSPNSIDLLLTDVPYFLLKRKQKSGEMKQSSTIHYKKNGDPENQVARYQSISDYRNFTLKWMQCIIPYLKPNAKCIIWTNYLGKQVHTMANNLYVY
jgi:DNA modification methylase